ncbi:YihY family inner membrane protein [Propionivibrio sp.]|uniref:YihY family inner membrane protein n=1 Tax=Propionivibrio sp. TaxID=2212460 RepID=UPI00260910F0|nr:YihY family inner membrane protein [Propionivibrio sp.]
MIFRLPHLRAFAARIARRFVEESFDQISASLAFTTLLSLVPLVAVVLGIMAALPSFPVMVDQLDQFVIRSLLPERSAGMIINYVLEFSQKAANVTFFGLAGLFASVLFLLLSVERAFNHVWRVTENRPWWKKLRLYATVLALWPFVVTGVVLAIYYAVTTSLGLIDEPEWLRDFMFKAAGLSVAAIFLAGLYFAVPNARVTPSDAQWAGLFAAIGFLLIQKVLQTFLWVSSTLSRMVFKEGVRWKAWSCIGNCWV